MKWTDYTTKETLKDNDELMILDKDANANKRTLMDKIWNYVVDKMTTAVIAKLETTNKTLIGAVNELNSKSLKYKDVSYDSITIPASGYVSLKKNGLSLSNIRMASIITYSRIDPPKPFCVYGNSTVAYVYGEPGTVITELKVRFWY